MTPFGQRLRYLRLNRGMSQKELAVRTGMRQGYVSCLETGARQSPSFMTVCRIAHALGVSVESFDPWRHSKWREGEQ